MRAFFSKSLLAASIFLVGANLSATVSAQESDTTVRYSADYFEEWAPVTAQDMLNRIPGVGSPTGGFNPNGGGGGRGLGAGGGEQILIDGKRMAGKGNQSSSQLSRISSSQVEYIEIIRGTSGDLDVRGSQIINVVLLEALDATSLSYQVNVDRYLDHHTQPGGSLAYSGRFGDLSLLLSAEAEPRYDHYVIKETSRLGDYSLNDEVRSERIREQTTYSYTSNIAYDINENSSVRLNGLYRQEDDPAEEYWWTTDLRVQPNIVTREREDNPGKDDRWEIGGDYEYKFNNGHRFKVLFITNERNYSNVKERYDIAADGAETKNRFISSAKTNQERIVRSSYTMGLADGQDLEFGAERAQTILDSSLKLGLPNSAGTPSDAFGGLVPQNVNNANSTVEEIRVEPFVVHNWKISPKLSLETSLVYEMSEITQTGDVYNQRDFGFFKPKVDLRYDVNSSFQLNWKAEKIVRQLSFNDFVAATDNQDNDANTQAGNANLKQEQVLRTELGFEYRLPDDIGVLDGDVFYMKHIDVIERIDVSTGTSLASANGNIGDGIMYGLNLSASVRMNIIDMPNLLVTSSFNVQDSKITDPFLGIERRFASYNRGRLQLGFRHDIPSLRLNYGMNWNNRFDGNMKRYDIDDIELYAGDPNVSAFVELVAFNDLTFRFDIRNATNNKQCRERQRFVGAITSGVIEEIEDQCGMGGRVLSLKINGTF
ncbi:MAG: TonB-dependent receptor [Pseudohongiellaceae bacterium]|nr:TonB-dependent receptor [Pseudohongiellaceae bacterium]